VTSQDRTNRRARGSSAEVTTLQSRGLRATPQRSAVLAALRAVEHDVTAVELYAAVLKSHPGIGLATVYRALGALTLAGLAHQLRHGDATCYRACDPGHHHHLTCRACHAVVELRSCDVEDWVAAVGDRHGYRAVEHVLELTGTCARCQGAAV
jgi:Fur family ferric uptake transcriptional regulator